MDRRGCRPGSAKACRSRGDGSRLPWHAAVATALLALVLPVIASAASPQDGTPYPPARPGLWELTTTIGSTPVIKASLCGDEAWTAMSQQFMPGSTASGSCKPAEVRTEGGKFLATAECNIGIARSRSITEGDLVDGRLVSLRSQMRSVAAPGGGSDPAPDTTLSTSAKWVHACPKDMKIGEMRVDGSGEVVNIKDFPGLKGPSGPRP